MIDFAKLAAPFPPSAVSWRVGSVSGERGMALAYLDARDVMDRLDDVAGPSNWQCRYSHVGAITVCEIGIWGVQGELTWVWKADGAGQSDIEAEKGALSDAFKRAAVRWGIGRYLYHLPSPWVQIEKRGKSAVIAKSEYPKLEHILAQASVNHAVAQPMTERPSLPPAEDDVVDAATRWFRDQKYHLENVNLDSDVFEWDDRNEKALAKLKLQHRDLWDSLTNVRLDALKRLAAPL